MKTAWAKTAVCKRMDERYGGRIWNEKEPKRATESLGTGMNRQRGHRATAHYRQCVSNC